MNSYKLLEKKQNSSLGFQAERYELEDYGSQHIHLKNKSKELVFMVMFRTIPENSTGVAHILEHTTLCGSENFKVRDPFFMMLRRSMSTFMNAFTASDWTAYPFATQSKKDFFNLLDVYLDAVYFPLLKEEDFKQEGHRLEFAKHDKSSSPLEFKGVVFNEMKGSMSNISSVTWQALTNGLFPDLTYKHNSGGEPEEIIELTHDYLKGFHQKFYHPSNATYFTWGDVDAKEIQDFVNKKLKQKFKKVEQSKIEVVTAQTPFSKPVKKSEIFNPVSEEQIGHQNYVAWVLGESCDINQLLEAHLVSLLLLGNSASPLYKALESNELGKSPAQILGLEDSMRHLMFICGIEGTKEGSQEDFMKLIEQTFIDISKNGFTKEQVNGALYQLELNRREVSAGSMPFGLQILLSMAPGALYNADPIALSDVDEAIKTLRTKVEDPKYLTGLVKKFFLENTHRVDLEMVPDMGLINRREDAFKKTLDKIKASMSSKDKLELVNTSKSLAERQEEQPNKDLLPKLELSDVPKKVEYPQAKKLTTFGYSPLFYEQPTNGLTYSSISRNVDLSNAVEVGDLMLMNSLLGKVGTKNNNYLKLQEKITSVSGGISSSSHFYYNKDGDLDGRIMLSSKYLPENVNEVSELMFEIFNDTVFDDEKRIKELMFQNFMGIQQSIVESGHRYAMLSASSTHNKLSLVNEITGGLSSLYKFAPFVSNNEQATKQAIENITKLHAKFKDLGNELTYISNIKLTDGQIKGLRNLEFEKTGESTFKLEAPEVFPKIAMPINTQVNFSALSMNAPRFSVEESPRFLLLSSILRNEFLHRRIREQGGAYGGGATYDAFAGTFKFFSYRDPRFIETYEDFQESFKWIAKGAFNEEIILEGKLSVLSDIDKPASPASEAFKDNRFNIEGKDQKTRAKYRQKVLETTKEEILEAANYFLDKPMSYFSIINPNLEKKAQEEGFEIRKI